MTEIITYWPIIVCFGGGLILWGETRYRVAEMGRALSPERQVDAAKLSAVMSVNLERIMRDVSEIKVDLKAHASNTSATHEKMWEHIGKIERELSALNGHGK